jgi:hypothetical protein
MTQKELEEIIRRVIVLPSRGDLPTQETKIILYLFQYQKENRDVPDDYVPKEDIIKYLESIGSIKRKPTDGGKRLESVGHFRSRAWRNLTQQAREINKKFFGSAYRNLIRIKTIERKGLKLLLGRKDVVRQLRTERLPPLTKNDEKIYQIVESCTESYQIRGILPDMKSLILVYRHRDSIQLTKPQLEVLAIGAIRQNLPACYWLKELDIHESRCLLLQELNRFTETSGGALIFISDLLHECSLVAYLIYLLRRTAHRSPILLTTPFITLATMKYGPMEVATFLKNSELDSQQLRHLLLSSRDVGTYETALAYDFFSYLLSDKELVDKILDFRWEKLKADEGTGFPDRLPLYATTCFVSLSRELRKRTAIDLTDFYLTLLNRYCEECRESGSRELWTLFFKPAEEIMKSLTRMLYFHPSQEKELAFERLLLEILKFPACDIGISIANKRHRKTPPRRDPSTLRKFMEQMFEDRLCYEKPDGIREVALTSLVTIYVSDRAVRKEIMSWVENPKFRGNSMIIWALALRPVQELVAKIYYLAQRGILSDKEMVNFLKAIGVKGDKTAINLLLETIQARKRKEPKSQIIEFVEALSTLGYQTDDWLSKSADYPKGEIGEELHYLALLGSEKSTGVCLNCLEQATSTDDDSLREDSLSALKCIDARHHVLSL